MSNTNQDERSGITVKGKKYTFRQILIAIVVILVLTFIIANRKGVTVNLLFAKLNISLAFLIFLNFGLGFFVGWLVMFIRSKKKQNQNTIEIQDVEPQQIESRPEE